MAISKQKQQEYNKRNYNKNRASIRLNSNAHNRVVYSKLRLALLGALGSVCCRCSFSDSRALQVDHVNGGGFKEIRKSGYSSIGYVKMVLAKVLSGSSEYQLLCANCNQIKKHENNEMPYFKTK